MAEKFDYKKLGLGALDVVVGIGSAVAGGYGGPEAAKGVQMAGSGIKGIVTDATGDGGRADKLDREDFQARTRVLEQRRVPLSNEESSDTAVSRGELIKQGWSPEQADQILSGPSQGVTLAALFGESEPESPAEQRPGRRNRGRTVPGEEGRRVPETEATTVKAERGGTVGGIDGSTAVAAIGKVLSGVLTSKG